MIERRNGPQKDGYIAGGTLNYSGLSFVKVSFWTWCRSKPAKSHAYRMVSLILRVAYPAMACLPEEALADRHDLRGAVAALRDGPRDYGPRRRRSKSAG